MEIGKVWTSVFAIILASVSFYFAVHIGQAKICHSSQRTWDTFQAVIGAATNPPSRAGTHITPEQLAALASYRHTLVDSLGDRPSC